MFGFQEIQRSPERDRIIGLDESQLMFDIDGPERLQKTFVGWGKNRIDQGNLI